MKDADVDWEWTRELGEGRILTMERVSAEEYRAWIAGFCGIGPTQDAALDDLLARVEDHNAASEDLARDLEPGGRLQEKLRQLDQAVDEYVRRQS